ncbi:MAG TPA: hypothetical protein VFN67_29140, partial [Polyangiales bacterium]|nr:hypothetical protein [Polyangiales bacterium]
SSCCRRRDVEGLYSDVTAGLFQPQDTSGKDFLRAYQVTNESGLVTFKTIYPGWYGTRTIHIHFKIRIAGGGTSNYDFTSQLYFDEEINNEVMELGPYNSRGARTVRNMNDQVFNGTGPGAGADDTPPPNGIAPGASTTVTLTPLASGKGYSAALKIGVMMG